MTAETGNKLALKHGGGAAISDISQGQPLRGLAAAAQSEVRTEYETSGAHAMVTGNAERLEAASCLYWHAIENAAQDGDIQTLDKYLARFGWQAGKAVSAWAEVRKGDKLGKGKLSEVLTAYSQEAAQDIPTKPQEAQDGAQ